MQKKCLSVLLANNGAINQFNFGKLNRFDNGLTVKKPSDHLKPADRLKPFWQPKELEDNRQGYYPSFV